jgi:hypothetical protein
MRRSRALLTVLCAVALGCPARPPAAGPGTAAAPSPLRIELTTSPGPGLRALLVNASKIEQPVLHDPRIQASRLVLVGEKTRRKAATTDTRRATKLDTTVRKENYELLPPGGSKLLCDERFAKGDDGIYRLRWGPYLFEKIEPGPYKAHVVFESERDTYTQGGSPRRLEGVWKGTVKSNEISITLP